MFYSYGASQQGTDHIKNGIVCQDSHKIAKLEEWGAVAAVADGLGSELYSDIASRIAVDVAVGYCADALKRDFPESEVLKVLETAFTLAQQKIEARAIEDGHDLDQYDTTLDVAALIGEELYCGHSGDSGIIALTTEGLFVPVTAQQRDDMNHVFPLYFGKSKWVFSHFENKVACVLLATDGMLDTFFPPCLQDEPVKIHCALAQYFMDPQKLHLEETDEDALRDRLEMYLSKIPDRVVRDDKTIAVILNGNSQISYQNDAYYKEPNWDVAIERHRRKINKLLYPNLFVNEELSSEAASSPALEEDPSDTSKCDDEKEREENIVSNTGKAGKTPSASKGRHYKAKNKSKEKNKGKNM